ncbi:MAG: T9SS type A sorting domain-containing protein [Saprospiraceae bacterium]|nr:T9SS type A sorting domain-containing protein [Saprospiraceae bacterium]
MQKHLHILLFLLVALVRLDAQGWEHIYGGSGQDAAKAIAATPDGGYIVTGYYNGNTYIYLFKIDSDGNLQWSKTFAQGASRWEGSGIVVTPDNGYVITGYIDTDGPAGPLKRDIYLLKTDAFGNKLWDKTFGSNLDDEGLAIKQQADGCFVVTGVQNFPNDKENVFVLKTDPQGNTLWYNNYGTPQYKKKGFAVTISPNNDIIVAGEFESTVISDKQAYALKVGPSGNLLKEQTFGTTEDDQIKSISATPDGNYLLGGFSNNGPGGSGYLLKIDQNLTQIWDHFIPELIINAVAVEQSGKMLITGIRSSNGLDKLNIIKADALGNILWDVKSSHGSLSGGNAILLNRGGAVVAGFSELTINSNGESYAYIVRADANGKILTSYIEANLFRDFNNNCVKDLDEPSLKNWIVRFEGNQDTVYTVSNNDGNIRLAVDTGTYNLVLFPPNSYWEACSPFVSVTVPSFFDTIEASLPVRAKFDCTRNEIDIATPILRRCSDNVYKIRYCNSGTVPSLDTRVGVVLDPMLEYVSSSILPFNTSGDTLFFVLGTLANGDCDEFTVTAFLDCNNTDSGQTHCVSAFITPNGFCDTIGWDGVIIAAQAFCENDSVKMVLSNVGIADMNSYLGYVIAEDVIMLTQPGSADFQFRLDAGKDSLVWSHPANGSTYRIIAQQSPTYPGLGYPTAAVEGCISDTSTSDISLGFYTMFPEDDADAFKETDCQESNETDYNPLRLKRGHPKGYDAAHHYVSPETDLDYLIQFRNTSADTVRQVIIRDTLSAALDPATVFPGASSHPYDFTVYGPGIVQFTIPNINLLPGGGAESEGFVKFRVAQKPNLPCETIIFNSAAIYFDFEAPNMSSMTFHTVCPFDSFIVVTKTRDIYVSGVEVKTYPNPAVNLVNFEISGIEARSFALQLYDIQGRLIHNQFFDSPTFQLLRRQLPAGEFIYRLSADGTPVASGKLIVR